MFFLFPPSSCHQLTDDRLMKLRVMSGKIYLPRLRSTYHHHPFSCIGHRTCGRGWTRWRNQGWFWFLLFPRLQRRPCLVSCLERNKQRDSATSSRVHVFSTCSFRENFFLKKRTHTGTHLTLLHLSALFHSDGRSSTGRTCGTDWTR